MNTLPNARSRAYNIWVLMRARCDNPRATVYKYYGGRGITYDERWKSFANFWGDMGSGYRDSLTLDRIDSNKDYVPSNCRWIPLSEQNNNKRNTRYFTINGITKSFKEWITESGVKRSTVNQRYYVCGWSIEESLFTPTHNWSRRVAS